MRAHDAINGRIPHVEVRARHVDFRTQHFLAILELARTHPSEEVHVFFNGPIPIRTVFPRLRQVSAILAHLFRRQVIHIGQPLLNELHGVAVERFKVVAGKEQVLSPIEPEPANVFLNGFNVLGFLLRWIRIIEAQVTARLWGIFLRETKVQADRLGMTDVKVAIRLGWKPGDDPAVVATGRHIGSDHFADEIDVGRLGCVGHGRGNSGGSRPPSRRSRALQNTRQIWSSHPAGRG